MDSVPTEARADDPAGGPGAEGERLVGGPGSMDGDRTLTCRDCGHEFTFSVGEQRFFAEKGLVNVPQRCPSCRVAARKVRAETPKDYHAIVCSMCGTQAMVPFAPRTDRPVYCSTCFDRVRAGERAGVTPQPTEQKSN